MKPNASQMIAAIAVAAVYVSGTLNAQTDKCASHAHWIKKTEIDPATVDRREELEEQTANFQWSPTNAVSRAAQITIPVVVHVLYHTTEQNISDAQVMSQIDVLNEDFRLLNTDSLTPEHPFWGLTIDTEIEFCLAQQDPNGDKTTGINRVFTELDYFVDEGEENMKFSESGGTDAWDATKYLNLWVCAFHPDTTTLGFAAFPSDLTIYPNYDGVVIRHDVFGTVGTAGTGNFPDNDLGRTATHEVGHWLNLRHIWGDDYCGDDFVADTPEQEDKTYGCPSFPSYPYNGCGGDSLGEMYMNYMDYVDDYCMNMFTYGQAVRMHAALEGPRSGLLSSKGCEPVTPEGVDESEAFAFSLYPNPAENEVTIEVGQSLGAGKVRLYDAIGMMVLEQVVHLNSHSESISLQGVSAGIYTLELSVESHTISKKLIVTCTR